MASLFIAPPLADAGRCQSGRSCSSSAQTARGRPALAWRRQSPRRGSGLLLRDGRGGGARGRTVAFAQEVSDGLDDGAFDDEVIGDADEDLDDDFSNIDPSINEENFPPHILKALRATREVPEVLPHQEWIRDGAAFLKDPDPEPFPPLPEPDRLGAKAREFKEEMRQREWNEFLENSEKIGEYKYMDLTNDARLQKVYKRKQWTHEEIVDFIGYQGKNTQVVIQPRTWRADYQHLRPYVPTTEEFLETHGRFFEEEDEEEDGILDSDFDDSFDGDLKEEEDQDEEEKTSASDAQDGDEDEGDY